MVGMTFGVVVIAGSAVAEQQTANAASRVEQPAQRAEAAALKVEERLTKRLRK